MSDHTRDQWINAQFQQRDEHVTHMEQVRSGPTGYVLLIQTAASRYFFKACQGLSTYEPALVAALAVWFPGSVPEVLAMNEAHHWLLMADAGPTVRSLIQADGDRTRSEGMLRQFARLQQKTAPYIDHLLALGVPDRRPDKLSELYDQLIADTPVLLVGQENGVSEADLARLRAFAPSIRVLNEQITSYNVPHTLQHDDFHTANAGLVGSHYRFFDWGESYIAHPFYSLLIALRDAKYILEYDEETLTLMRDAYLECWTTYEPLDRLVELLPLTHQLAALSRALTWWQALLSADEHYRAENADAVPYWLFTFLNNTPME